MIKNTHKCKIKIISFENCIHFLGISVIIIIVLWLIGMFFGLKCLHDAYECNFFNGIFNLCIGLFTGYVVYLLSVYFPEKKKADTVLDNVNVQLTNIYYKSIYLLLLMYKCCCNEEEWREALEKSQDVDCFDSNYYKIMKRFDLNAEAYTMLINPKTGETFSWGTYLHEKYKEITDILDELVLVYNSYLDYSTMKKLLSIKNSYYYSAFMGTCIGYEQELTNPKNNCKYIEDVPVNVIYESTPMLRPFFDSNSLLEMHINDMKELQTLVIKLNNKFKWVFNNSYALDKLKCKDMGILGSAVFHRKNLK